MGFRFRRSVRILPSIRLNFGKRGVSTSVGVRGAHVTARHGHAHETVELPGAGLSYTHVDGTHRAHQEAPGEAQPVGVLGVLPKGRAWRGWLWIGVLVAIAAIGAVNLAHAETVSSASCEHASAVGGHPEIWGFVGVIVGGILTGGMEFLRRWLDRKAKARELRLARGEEILQQLAALFEWSEAARKTAFVGDIYIPVQVPAFRVAAIVEIFYPSLSASARDVDTSSREYRQILVDIAADKTTGKPMNPEHTRSLQAAAEQLPLTIGRMIEDTRNAVRQVLNGGST
jgi:hypothetical protein